MLFAYFGPDNILPLTSIIATVVGFFMMFGRRSIQYLGSFLFWGRSTPKRTPVARTPHSAPHSQVQSPSEPSA